MNLRKEFTMLMIKDYTVLDIPLPPPETWGPLPRGLGASYETLGIPIGIINLR